MTLHCGALQCATITFILRGHVGDVQIKFFALLRQRIFFNELVSLTILQMTISPLHLHAALSGMVDEQIAVSTTAKTKETVAIRLPATRKNDGDDNGAVEKGHVNARFRLTEKGRIQTDSSSSLAMTDGHGAASCNGWTQGGFLRWMDMGRLLAMGGHEAGSFLRWMDMR